VYTSFDTAAGLTVTLAVPDTEPSVALTVAEPAVVPAEYRPVVDIVPTPVTDQVIVSPVLVLPNLSLAVAVNCCF